MKFEKVISRIKDIDAEFRNEAGKSVNRLLTLRNWLIGYYIVEFEQNGVDRARYGDGLIDNMASELNHIKGIDKRALFRFRQFYLYYPQIADVFQDTSTFNFSSGSIVGSVNPLLTEKMETTIVVSSTPQFKKEAMVPGQKLISKLSYTHIEQFLGISDPQKRLFYEIECIKGTWSVRELRRQINSLYYERSGLSKDPNVLSEQTLAKTNPQPSASLIKNVYAFEFLGLPVYGAVEESDLETALLDHLRAFILELGNGFCLEARQKRILIGDEYFFIDLVFYHRILKCHVLLELKVEEFNHANAGQLNTYLTYYKNGVMTEGDNDPIGILMVTDKNEALVQYATAGMDQNLFVSKYLLQLPSAKQLQDFIINELKIL